MFGLAILTFNFTMEYVALDGETPLTELPSAQSILKRFGVGGIGRSDPATGWRPFLEEQSRTTLRMFIPYSLLGSLKYYGTVTESPTWLSNRLAVALGIALSAVCLIGSLFVRPRILFVTLGSFGFVWALPMRHYTALHESESIYYIGLPLVFFTIVLLLARRLTNRDGVIAAASAATLLLFVVSSFQMSRVGYNVETDPAAKTAVQDLLAMRELTAGEIVIVPRIDDDGWFSESARYALGYYLKSLVNYRILSLTTPQGFIVMHERIDSDALLTPQNQYLFLYDAHSLTASLTASYRSEYPSVASSEPLARKDFDVYLEDKTMYYLKEPCEPDDTKASFFLHVFPTDFDDLPYPRREHRFDNLDFGFNERGVMFDGKCMARVGLPQYDIAGIRIGRVRGDGTEVWSTAHVIQGPRLISEYQTIVSREPIARAEFDLYIDGGNLYYVKEPCTAEDTQAGFFLHVVPKDEDDLPDARREHGFDNLDFGFDVRGVVFDGKCLAGVDLPQYAIARIVTGQFDGADRIWQAEFAPDARE